MAIFYTNFLTGSDETGDGSWMNPYKSIWKASQMITANGDEVRVAGGSWIDLPGTYTFNNVQNAGSNFSASNTAVPSQNIISSFPELTSTISGAKTVITVDDQFGYDKTMISVVAVGATSLTLASQWGGNSGTFSCKKISAIHYTTNSAIFSSPAGVSGVSDTISNVVNSYEDIKITGGWTAENIQDGWTVFSTEITNGTTISGSCLSFQTPSFRGQNLYISRFLMLNRSNLFNIGNNLSYSLGELATITSGFSMSNAYFLFNDKQNNRTKFYLYDTPATSGSFNGDYFSDNCPSSFEYDLYFTMSRSGTNTVFPRSNSGAAANNSLFNDQKTCNELHLRSNRLSSSLYNTNVSGFNSTGGYFKNFYFYCNSPNLVFQMFTSLDSPLMIDKIFLSGDHVNTNTLKIGNLPLHTTNLGSYIGDGTQEIEKMRWSTGGSVFRSAVSFTQSMRSMKLISINGIFRLNTAIEATGSSFYPGLLWGISNSEFLTGNKSLVLQGMLMNSGNSVHLQAIASFPKPQISKTLRITLKSNGIRSTDWQNVVVMYSMTNSTTKFVITPIEFPLSVNENWQDYDFIVNPSSYPFWNIDGSPLLIFIEKFTSASHNAVNAEAKLYIDKVQLI